MADDIAKVKNIHQRIAAITGEVDSVQKTGKNKEQGYDFIEYDAVTAVLRKLMEKHGITVLQNTKDGGRHETEIKSKYGAVGVHLIVDYIFTITNVDDPADKLEFLWHGEASDYGDKATNKAATAAEKYFLLKLFKIGSKDDPDKESPGRGDAESKPATTAKPAPVVATATTSTTANGASEVQRQNITKLLGRLGYTDPDAIRAALIMNYDVTDPDHMDKLEAGRVIKALYADATSASNPGDGEQQ